MVFIMPGPWCFLCGRKVTPIKLSIIIFVSVVIFNEYLIYVIQSMRWPDLPAVNRHDGSTQVILLVADPQIQGYKTENKMSGPYARWDIDRYLKTTFSLAVAHTEPDLVIFLGDLMDEGSRASKEEYKNSYYRFLDIFSSAKHVQKIYIPGDNDIGGEFRDVRTAFKVDRFEKHFEEINGVVKKDFIDYIKADVRLQDTKTRMTVEYQKIVTSPIRVVLNHESLLPLQFKAPLYPILSGVGTHLILSAHWHRPIAYICDDCLKDDDVSWSVHQRDLTHMRGFMYENLTRTRYALTEVMVPTCSYRMGESYMGFGVAIISKNGGLMYGILWSPNRYHVLYSYIFILLTVVICNVFIYLCCRNLHRHGKFYPR